MEHHVFTVKAIFFSDAHLTDTVSERFRRLLRFLKSVVPDYPSIYILGDLFDVWPATTPYLVRKFKSVLDVLTQLQRGGHSITYIEGNHDFHLGDYFTREMGIRVIPEGIIENLEGKSVYMCHGDAINPHDIWHHRWRSLLRHTAVRSLLTRLPGELTFSVGRQLSSVSRKSRLRTFESHRTLISRNYQRLAQQVILKKQCDVVVMGHTHLPEHLTMILQGTPREYVNTGDWLDHPTYVEFDKGIFHLKRLSSRWM